MSTRVDVTDDTRVAGSGILRFERVRGRTVAERVFASSPLRLLTPRNSGRAAWVYTSTFGGGLVDGDALSLDLDVRAGAAVFAGTQASTKIYRSPRGTSNIVRARVADAALLVLMPDPTVCFAGARFAQSQHIDLAPTASLVLVDCLSAGRQAFGERWNFDKYDGRIFIRRAGRTIVYDALVLTLDDGDLATRLGRFNVVASVALTGPQVAQHANDLVSRVAELPVRRRHDLIQVASTVGEDGCLFRVAGVSLEEVSRVIRERLAFLPDLLGDDPWARKW